MKLKLRELVEALKKELAASPVEDPFFSVEKAIVTTTVTARETSSAEGGLEFWVVKATGSAESEDEISHEVTIQLRPLDDMPLLGDE